MNIGAFSCLYLLKKDGQYKENISDLSGISKKHPIIAISFGDIIFPCWRTAIGRIFCKILCFCSCFGAKNVCISNNWFTHNSDVSFLLP